MSETKEKVTLGKKIRSYLATALSGMAMGLFSTLIIGLIIRQIGIIIGPTTTVGQIFVSIGTLASVITGAGIGVGIAKNMGAGNLAMFSSAVTGFIGANASALLAAKLFNDKMHVVLTGPGDPLGAMIAAIVGIECAKLIAGKTKVDILLVPLTTILSGAAIGLLVGPPISAFMISLGNLIKYATEMQPFLMGIIVSVLVGTCLTFPLSSAALSFILGLSGLPGGAATVGCCCQMVGFAAASFRENGWQGLIAQGIGTSKIQLPNIVKNPKIFLPSLISSIVLGPVATVLFKMENNPAGSGMGSAGFVGQFMTYSTMTANGVSGSVVLIKIVILHFILPFALAFGISEFLRKIGWIKPGDMKLNV